MKPFLLFSLFSYFALLSSAQESDNQYHSKFTSAMERGQIQAAILICEEWKALDNSSISPYYFAAKSLARKGRKREAIENIKHALAIDSTHVPSLLAYAELAKQTNKSDALLYYEKLVVINPSNAYFYREAAESAVEILKLEKAIAYYSLAYQFDSLDLITVNGFAKLLLQMEQYADADSLLDRTLKLDSTNRFARLTKAKLAFTSEEWKDVLAWLEPIKVDRSSPSALRYTGISLYHLGRYEEAIDVLRNLSNFFPRLDYPHYYMGLCMEKLGQLERAATQYGQAVNKALSNNLGTYYERLGLMQQKEGMHKEAIHTFLMAKNFSAKNVLNFHLAKSYDVYYQDRTMAVEMFKTYIKQEETQQSQERAYAESRLAQLIKDHHFHGN